MFYQIMIFPTYIGLCFHHCLFAQEESRKRQKEEEDKTAVKRLKLDTSDMDLDGGYWGLVDSGIQHMY